MSDISTPSIDVSSTSDVPIDTNELSTISAESTSREGYDTDENPSEDAIRIDVEMPNVITCNIGEDGNTITVLFESNDNSDESEVEGVIKESACTPDLDRSINISRISPDQNKDNDDSDLSIQISSEESSNEMFSLSTLDDSLSSYLIRTPGRVEVSKTSSNEDKGDSSRSSDFIRYDREDMPDIVESNDQTDTTTTDLDTTSEFIETPDISSTPFSKTPSVPSFKRSGIIKSLFVPTDNIVNCDVLDTSYDDEEFIEQGIEIIVDDPENENCSCKTEKESLSSIENSHDYCVELNEDDHSNMKVSSNTVRSEKAASFENQEKEILNENEDESQQEEQKQKEWGVAVVKLRDVEKVISMDWKVKPKADIIDEKGPMLFKCLMNEKQADDEKGWKFNIDSSNKKEKNEVRWKYKLSKFLSRPKNDTTEGAAFGVGCKDTTFRDKEDSWNITINEIKMVNDKDNWRMNTTTDNERCCGGGGCSIS